MDAEKLGELSVYKMISDEIKLNILKLLSQDSRCVGDIVKETGVAQPLVSHKLKDLRENGLVTSVRDGKRIVYSLSDDSISDLLTMGKRVGENILRVCNCAECEEQDPSRML